MYEVTQAHGYEASLPVTLAGAALQQLQVAISDKPGSVLIEYRRLRE